MICSFLVWLAVYKIGNLATNPKGRVRKVVMRGQWWCRREQRFLWSWLAAGKKVSSVGIRAAESTVAHRMIGNGARREQTRVQERWKWWKSEEREQTLAVTTLLLCSNVWGGKHGGEDWSKLTEQPGTIFNVRKRREKKDTDKPHDWKRGKRREARKESASYVSRLFLIPKVFSTYSSSPQLCVRNVIWCCGVLTYRRFIDIIMYLSFSHHYEGSIDFN